MTENWALLNMTTHNRTWQNMTEHDRTWQNRTWQSMTEHDRTWQKMTEHDRTWQYMTERTWQIGEPALHLQRGAWLQLEVVSLGGEVGHVACTRAHTQLEILRFYLINFVVLIKDKWAVPLFTPSLLSLSRLLLHLDFYVHASGSKIFLFCAV